MNRSMLAPVGFTLAGVGLLAAYLAMAPTRTTEFLAAGAMALSAAVILGAMFVHRPVRPVPWVLLAVGLAVSAAARVGAAFEWYGTDGVLLPGAAEMWGVLAFPSLLVATISISSDRRHARDLLAGSEPIIYVIALTALVWLAVTGQYVDDGATPLTSEAWIWMFPLLPRRAGAVRTPAGQAQGGALLRVQRDDARLPAVERRQRRHRSRDLRRRRSSRGRRSQPRRWWARCCSGSSRRCRASRRSPSATASRRGCTGRRSSACCSRRWYRSGALILMLATGLSSRSSFIVVSVATVSVIVLALARMWRLVDQVRLLTEQRGHDRLAAMVEHSSDVVMLADQTGRVSYASPGLRATLGFNPESWVGRHLLDVIIADEREGAMRQFERLVEFGNGGTVEFDATLSHSDGQQRKATVVVANLVGGAAVDGIVATFRDVTEQRNLERQLSHRAFHDELTGLANRALFLDRMDHALRVTRPEVDPVVVLFVDLDDFKSVNDALGHAVGDQLLKTVADRIRRAAGTGDTAARLGGDEFAILLEDRGGIDRAIDVAERLLDSLREPVSIAGYDVAVLASVGVAVASPGMSTTSLLRDADIAMYEAKRAGKGQIRIFDPAMRLVATKHLEYRSDLGEAIERGQLRLVYMPFVDLRSGQVTGAEALVRWHHPEHGDIPASEFIPIAERSGLIVPMGYWVLEQGLAHVATWRPDLFASFNVSAVQIRQPDFVERVDRDRRSLSTSIPRTIMFELTETVLVDEGDRAIETVRPPARARLPLRDRRLRRRVLLAELPAASPGRPAEDRSHGDRGVRQRPARQHAGAHDPADGRLARPAHRRRGHRDHGTAPRAAPLRLRSRPGLPAVEAARGRRAGTPLQASTPAGV